MQSAWAEVKADPDQVVIMGLEHPPVVTLGKRATLDEVHSVQIPVFQTDRGGQATIHSPGQLVIYPVLNLRHWDLGLKDFVDLMLTSTQNLLSTWGIETELAEPAGLQTRLGKIAFMGLRVDQGITRHGLSLNISNDLSYFQGITACGVKSARIDRAEAYLSPCPTPESAFRDWQEQLKLVVLDQNFSKVRS